MTLKTSFIVGLAVAALVVGVEIASAAPTSDGPQPTNFVQPDFGQKLLVSGGRLLAGLRVLSGRLRTVRSRLHRATCPYRLRRSTRAAGSNGRSSLE